jgi:hypothetical protein
MVNEFDLHARLHLRPIAFLKQRSFELSQLSFGRARNAAGVPFALPFDSSLTLGKSEAIILACKAAQRLGIPVTGTIGLLLRRARPSGRRKKKNPRCRLWLRDLVPKAQKYGGSRQIQTAAFL